MTVNEWLKGTRGLDIEIKILRELKAETINGRRGNSKPARQFIALLDRQIEKDTAYLSDVKELINGLENENYKQVLTEKWINKHTFEEVADIMYYSVAYVQQLHKKAVHALEPEYLRRKR